MQKVTVTLEREHVRELEARQRLGQAASRSAALRGVLTEADELRAECERLRTECAECERRCERLQNEKQVLIEQLQRQHDTAALVEYVDEQKQAGVVERAKWWLFGRD